MEIKFLWEKIMYLIINIFFSLSVFLILHLTTNVDFSSLLIIINIYLIIIIINNHNNTFLYCAGCMNIWSPTGVLQKWVIKQ